MNTIENKLALAAKEIYRKLDLILPKNNEELYKAIRYSAMSGGKCIRGFLVIEFCKLFNFDPHKTILLASIIELIHSFSLIHDDLPALDNSDIRRGKASCHKKFSESTAILAGDAILVVAYNLLGEHFPNLVSFASKYILEMVNGQIYDLNNLNNIKHNNIDDNKIGKIEINRMKTGAMFALSCASGPYLCNADPDLINQAINFGYNFGILFQLIDDIKDADQPQVEAKTEDFIKVIEDFLNLDKFKSMKKDINELLNYINGLC